MLLIPQLLLIVALLGTSLVHVSVLLAALVSIFAPTTERRRDARSTLTILVRRRSR